MNDSGHREIPQFEVPALNNKEITPEGTGGTLDRPLPDGVPFETKLATCPGAIKQSKCRVMEQPLIPYTSLLKLQHIAKNPRQWKIPMALSSETHLSTTTTNLHPNGKQGQVFTHHQIEVKRNIQSQKTPDFSALWSNSQQTLQPTSASPNGQKGL